MSAFFYGFNRHWARNLFHVIVLVTASLGELACAGIVGEPQRACAMVAIERTAIFDDGPKENIVLLRNIENRSKFSSICKPIIGDNIKVDYVLGHASWHIFSDFFSLFSGLKDRGRQERVTIFYEWRKWWPTFIVAKPKTEERTFYDRRHLSIIRDAILNVKFGGFAVEQELFHVEDEYIGPFELGQSGFGNLRLFIGRAGSAFRSIGGFFSVNQAIADELQLHIEKRELNSTYNHQSQGKVGNRIVPPIFLLYMAIAFGGGIAGTLILCRITGMWERPKNEADRENRDRHQSA